jgi:hypothetical protein
MQKLILAAAVAAGLAAAGTPTWAQAPIEKEAPTATKLNLTLEQRHTIKELMKDSKIEKAPADVHLAVGAKVPESLKLHEMPSEIGAKVSQVKTHLVVLQGTEVVIVEPKDRTVADIID